MEAYTGVTDWLGWDASVPEWHCAEIRQDGAVVCWREGPTQATAMRNARRTARLPKGMRVVWEHLEPSDMTSAYIRNRRNT